MAKLHRFAVVLTASALLPICAAAQDCPPQQAPDMQLGIYLRDLEACDSVEQAQVDTMVEAAPAQIAEMVSALPSGSDATSGFASRVRDSLTDFLPLFNLGGDALVASEDGSALTVNFNPVRSGDLGSLGVTLQIQEPEPSNEVLMAVAETQRSALQGAIDGELGDFDNLTWTIRWGYERALPANVLSRDEAPWLWGRSYKRYRPLVEKELLPAFKQAAIPSVDDELLRRCMDGVEAWVRTQPTEFQNQFSSVRNLTFAQLDAALGTESTACVDGWVAEKDRVIEADAKLDALSLLPFLIDNQPQLVASLSFDERDELVGRDKVQASVSFELGLYNLNTLLKQNAEGGQGILEALDSFPSDLGESENKFTFSLRYVERSALAIERTFGEGDDAIDLAVDLPKSEEWCGQLQFSRNATWNPLTIDGQDMYPRFHLSAEYVDVSDDPQRQDRFVAKATYEMPVSGSMTIPVSLTYASKAEFLGDVDEQLSAHLGLSYKIPEKPGKSQ